MPANSQQISVLHRTSGGRVRLLCPDCRGAPEKAGALRSWLSAHDAIGTVKVRSSTGSAIVTLNRPIGDEDLCTLIAEALKQGSATSDETEWQSISSEETARRLDVDISFGLTAAAVETRRARWGENRLPNVKRRTQISLLAEQFESLPVAMLMGSAVVSLATGGAADAGATIAVVLLNAAFGYVTEGQAEASISKLMDSSDETVTVLRDGQLRSLKAWALVPGDVYVARPGRVIAADARLIQADRLRVDESALTGETLPVAKAAEAEVLPTAPIGARPTMLQSGTLVAEGTGRAIVTATGGRTAAAQIAMLSETATRPRAPVEAELDRVGALLVKVAIGACGIFFGVGLLRGMSLPMILKDALALAVAAVPEGLPVVATTTMSIGLRRMERRGVLVRQVDTVESLGSLQILCLDKTGTLTQNKLQVVETVTGTHPSDPEVPGARRVLLEVAALNSEAKPGEGRAEGSSGTERALLDHARAAGIDVACLRAARPMVTLYERRPERPYMVTVHEGNGPSVLAKGAPESVLALCETLWDGTPLDADARTRIRAANDLLAARPARVLAFAAGDGEPRDGVPSGLRWIGLAAMVDPLRPGAGDFIAAMHRAGIRTIMITGDQSATAASIARELDLSGGEPLRIIDSPEIAALNPDLLGAVAKQAHVFSRVSATQKLAIVQALQRDGSIIGMTGDGVNDGPALKAANVGIAMGGSGTDLARDVANVVIRDDELTTLIDAVAQGRAVYRNIRRALEYLIATNLSEIALGIVEAVHGPAELESPMELLWINLVSDVLPGLGLALADPDPDAMERPPRAVTEHVIPPEHFHRMTLDGATIAAASLTSHFVGLARFGPGPETRSMTFLSLSLGQLIYALTCQRSDISKLQTTRLLENRMLDSSILASTGLAILPFVVPGLRRLLKIAPLDPVSAAVGVAGAVAPSAVVLARRRARLGLETVEARPCATS